MSTKSLAVPKTSFVRKGTNLKIGPAGGRTLLKNRLIKVLQRLVGSESEIVTAQPAQHWALLDHSTKSWPRHVNTE